MELDSITLTNRVGKRLGWNIPTLNGEADLHQIVKAVLDELKEAQFVDIEYPRGVAPINPEAGGT